MINTDWAKRLSYRSDIDGLRAIAVLSVIFFHLSPKRMSGGFVGVDVFFVISGFLISSIIYNELETGSFSIGQFYVRRIRRIYPALFTVLASVCIAGWLLLSPSDFVLAGKQIVGGSTFVANFVLWSQSGYFSVDAAKKPLLHLWSLGVEEQYYLMFPLLCVVLYRIKARWVMPSAFLAIAVASMIVNVAFVGKYSEATYFLPFSRLWELFVGAGLALALQRDLKASWEDRLPAWRSLLGFLGFGLLGFSLFRIEQDFPFPGWWALLPTFGTAMVIAAGESSWINRHVLSFKPLVLVGLISYPLYLWHWPVLSFVRAADRVQGVEFSHFLKTATFAISFVLAYLTYRLVEVPIRQVKDNEKRRRGALWLLGCVSMTGAFGMLVVLTGGFPSRAPSAIVALDHDYGSDASRAYREGTCFLRSNQTAAAFSPSCLDGMQGGSPQPLVFVWGDSHAADLMPGFRSLQQASGVRLAQYTTAQCGPILGLVVNRRPYCASTNSAVLDRVRALKPDIVVLSASWDSYDVNQNPALAQQFLTTIEAIETAGVKRVVVIGSVPAFTNTVPRLLVNELYHNIKRPAPHRLSTSLLKPHDDTMLRATVQKAGAVYVPLFDVLCDQSSCIVTTGSSWQNVVIYDSNHFTEHGSILVAQHIWPAILHPESLVDQIRD